MRTQISERQVYFDDPRLKMTLVGRMAVRVTGYVTYLFLLAATVTFLFLVLRIEPLFYLGVLLAVFFIDSFIHKKEADRPLSEMPKSGRVNLASYLIPTAFGILEQALDKTALKKTNLFLEVLGQLVELKGIEEGLVRMSVPLDEFKQKLYGFLDQSIEAGVEKKTDEENQLQVLALGAFNQALANKHQFIEPSDLFSALLSSKNEFIQRLFSVFQIEKGDMERALIFSSLQDQFSRFKKIPATLGGFVPGEHRRIRHRIMNRAWTSRPTPTLDQFSSDLTDLARQERVGFLIGHKLEYERLVETLARSVNPNVMLVGEEGIGKETLVSHLAFQLTKDTVPEPIFDKRLVSLQLNELVAGATQEELQARLERIVDEITTAGNVVLYIPDFHNLVKTSGTAYLSAADALVPVVKNNDFPVIGATYPREFKESLEARSDITGIFEVIRVNEITEAEAEEILVHESLILEREAKVLISFGAIKRAVRLGKKYFTNQFLPSSADGILKSALVLAGREKEKVLTPELVVRAAEEKINVPIHEVGKEEAAELLNLEARIKERLIGQEEAVKAVSNVLREYRSGLTKAGKPMASFLFVGPTGVGKTELAKILTEIMFGSKDLMVRFDMTEYQDKQSFFRFIGSPDGKVSGALTDAILKKPYSLILLDEFEKAFPDILNLFLQVFDDGRLTDNLGRTVDFQNTMIVATSNAHSDIINEALRAGQKMADIAEYLKKKLTDVFRPELLNRFSKIVIFNSLSAGEIKQVAALNLKDFAKMTEGKGIVLSFDPLVVEEVARLGYEPAFGARPLGRVIADRLRAPLAEKILREEVVKGGKYKVVLRGGEFQFEKEG